MKCKVRLLFRRTNGTPRWVVIRPNGKRFAKMYCTLPQAVREAVLWQEQISVEAFFRRWHEMHNV